MTTPAPMPVTSGIPSVLETPPPKGSEKIRFTLQEVVIEGATYFDEEALSDTFAEFKGKSITLDKVWVIANRITQRYQQAGFFLSRAIVPQQKIKGGAVHIQVVEGYIGTLSLDDKANKNRFVRDWLEQVVNVKPLKYAALEEVLLHINQLPGHNYRAVLQLPKDKNAPEGSTELNIVTLEEKPKAHFSYDNFGSVYLGPGEMTQSISMSIIPNQRTTLVLLGSTQIRELRYLNLMQEIPLNYDWTLDLGMALTAASPGDSLAIQEIASNSRDYQAGFTYRPLVSREQNLALRFGVESRDVRSNILGSTPLTDDSIRLVQAGANYQLSDDWSGFNLLGFTLSRGLSGFEASKSRAPNLSRAEAVPNFTKSTMSYTRYQPLPLDIGLVASASGQVASDPLYSSEEFGYGGQNFGRAYDNSEITGDQGVAGSLELRYQGIPVVEDVGTTPYVFYDVGKVWNYDADSRPQSGSSAGGGVRLVYASGLSANIGFAYPLTREIASPINGRAQGPRFIIQVGADF